MDPHLQEPRPDAVDEREGCSPDNAAAEGFFGRLKNELFYGRDWRGVATRSSANAWPPT